MWTCKKCGKPVYFAERKKSMGFDWHPRCLQCAECGKVLHPGQHAEHKDQPYCHIPCYSALFGPKLFGHGSSVESHQSFGKRSGQKLLADREFEKKVREYNEHTKKISGTSKLELTSRFVNGRLVLEGVLRVYWGVQRSIRVKEFEDKRPITKRQPSSASSTVDTTDSVIRRAIKPDVGKIKSHNPFYRHSVNVFQTAVADVSSPIDPLPDDLWQYNNNIVSSDTIRSGDSNAASHEVVERTLLHRTLSDSNLLEQDHGVWSKAAPKARSYLTLPANFGRTKAAVVPLRMGRRYAAVFDLSNENSTLKYDLTSLQPEVLNNGNNDEPGTEDTEEPETNEQTGNDETDDKTLTETKPRGKGGPRALRRRHGRKFDKTAIRRRSSFNGHWYDRETSVFTPPKDSCMSVWTTSMVATREVIQMILDKYKIENEPERFALFVVKETGERRLVGDTEFPLILRVNLGAYEEIARLYIFDRQQTTEVSHEVAQYLRFSYAECRAILNMFYEEEEREVDFIHRKYKLLKKRIGYLIVNKWTPNHV